MTEIGFNPNIDTGLWNTALLKVGEVLQSSFNKFSTVIQTVIKSSNSKNHIEQGALIVEALTEDFSSLNINRDCVAISARSIIRSGNLNGRACALEVIPTIETNADGIGWTEFGFCNRGSDQPNYDTPTTKILQSCIPEAFGSLGHVTGVRYITSTTNRPKFYHGDTFRQGAFVDIENSPVIEILKFGSNSQSFVVKANGDVLTQRLRPEKFFNKFVNGTFEEVIRNKLEPGEEIFWGDTTPGAGGITYKVFFNGQHYLRTPYHVWN